MANLKEKEPPRVSFFPSRVAEGESAGAGEVKALCRMVGREGRGRLNAKNVVPVGTLYSPDHAMKKRGPDRDRVFARSRNTGTTFLRSLPTCHAFHTPLATAFPSLTYGSYV